MTVRVIINGAQGKMGHECVKAFQDDPEFVIVGKTGKLDSLTKVIQENNAQIVVDLTAPNIVFDNTLAIINANARPVIGTTGLTAEQITMLEKLCAEKKLGGVIAPNFSIGAILMMRFAQQAAQYLPDVEIIELHHPAKLDAPSGTAIKTAELIAQNRKNNSTISASRESIGGVRGGRYQDIPIHSVRLPGVLADQEIIFGGPGETLTISHKTLHRECFMPGIKFACKKVMELNRLVYGLDQLL